MVHPGTEVDLKQEQGAMSKESPENKKECLEIKNRIAKIKRINREITKRDKAGDRKPGKEIGSHLQQSTKD